MKRRMIATVTAAALALTTAMASPVAAGDRDKKVLTLLLGAAAVGLLINEANKNKKRNAAPVTRTYDSYGYGYRDDHGRYDDDDDHDKKWRKGDRRRQSVIPPQCVFSLRGTRGPREVVSGRCMSELGVGRHLPRSCAFEINSHWGTRTVYGTRCLQENGYRIARAH